MASQGQRGEDKDGPEVWGGASPEGPCTHIAYTLGPMYLYRDYFKANVFTI